MFSKITYLMTKLLTDQLGKTHFFASTPNRIVSLVPSQTETLVDLGLEKSIVGITKFCVHPIHLKKEKTIVGGTKNINIEKIKALNPDIIICNKEENTKEIIENLSHICPVWVTDIVKLESNNKMISDLGDIFDIKSNANKMIEVIDYKLLQINNLLKNNSPKNVAYLIWKNPWMAVGHSTYINEILLLNNLNSVFNNAQIFESRYPEFEFDRLKNLALDYIFLSSEPYPFKKKETLDIQNLTGVKTILVDGEMFSWHGSRLIKALDYFADLHKQIVD